MNLLSVIGNVMTNLKALQSPVPAPPIDTDLSGEQWNVVSSGPSILRMQPEDLLPGPTIAINRGIHAVARGVKVDAWVCWDDPKILGLIDRYKIWYEPRMEIWMNRARQEAWEEVVPGGNFRHMPGGIIAYGEEGWYKASPSIFLALEQVVKCGGRVIRCFGVDMRGSSRGESFLERWRPEEDEIEAQRWAYERDAWDRMTKAALERGVIIERVVEGIGA